MKVFNFIEASVSRTLSALVAALFWFFIFRMIEEPKIITEILAEPKGFVVILSVPIIAIVFTAYAIGGQKLLRKFAPKLAEKESNDLNN